MAIIFSKGGGVMDIFSIRLKSLRKDREKTQEDMSKLLHIQRSTYGEYERGKILPPVDKLKVLADYFGVSVDYLMGHTNFKTHEERQEKDAMDVSKNLRIILESLENQNTALTFNGDALDADSREMLISTLQNGLKMADILNKSNKS